MLSAQNRWMALLLLASSLSVSSWNAIADEEPADKNAAAPGANTPATTDAEAEGESPVQTRVPYADDEVLYNGDTVITVANTPLIGNQREELATLDKGSTLVVRQVSGQWILVDAKDHGKPVAGWVERTSISLISAEAPGVLHKSIKNIPKRLAELHASSEDLMFRANFMQSLETCSAVLKLDPTSALAFYRRGYCQQMLDQHDKAIEDLDRAIQLEPKYEQAYLLRGDANYSRGEYDQAMVDYELVLSTNPSSAGALYMRGRCKYAKGQYDQAIADYNAVLEFNPNHTWAIAHRGDAYFAKQDFDAAIADLDKATQIDRAFDWAIARRGDVWYSGKQDIDRAIADYTFANTINPRNSWAIHQRGHCLEKKNNYAQAVADYAEAVKLDPEYWDFLVNLAWVLATCPEDTIRDGDKATELATRACELTDWTDSFSLGALAAANAEAGKFDKAIELQKKAIAQASPGYDDGLAKAILETYRSNQPYYDK